MKFFIVLVFLIVISVCNSESTVYEQGKPGGSLLFKGNRGSKSGWSPLFQLKKVRYPVYENYEESIGYLKIVNNIDSPKSCANVLNGGVGYNYVEIEYRAPPFNEYDYNVEINGVA